MGALGSSARRAAKQAALAAAATALVGACATESSGPDMATGGEVGDFAATSEYLAAVADGTDGLTYRMSMDMTMNVEAAGGGFEISGTFMTGETDGDRSAMTIDFGEVFRDMAGQLPAGEGMPEGFLDADLSMEMVTDGTTGYLRAPFFAAMADMMAEAGLAGDDLGPLAELARLGDEWGRLDLTEVSPSQVASTAGGQAMDPSAFLDIIARATDVQELGTETIDGVESRGLGATVTYGDMIEAQGMDVDDVREQMSAGAGAAADAMGDEEAAEIAADMFDAMFAMEMPVEVWVDGDDRVRRARLEMDMAEIVGAVAENAGDDLGDSGMSTVMVMNFTDYDDESIEIEIPAESEDITAAFLELQEGGGLDGGTGPLPG
jgi:hypothetical protein